jgi:uncharacterized membrane protein YdjX (TVP38/TMEM64 family)
MLVIRGNRYLLLVAAVLVVGLCVFLLAEALSLPVVDDPGPWLTGGGPLAAAVGVGLLVGDVALPVPASLVMVAHGALFGVVPGAGLSLAGAVGAALAGYGLGRWAGPPVVRRVCSPQERERAAAFVRRWGLLAVVASRPVPLLAETVAVVAGAERLGALRTVLGAAVGALPAAALYAVAGAHGAAGPGGLVVLAGVLGLAALLWLLGRRAS